MKIFAIINPISGIGPKSQIPAMLAEKMQHTEHELVMAYTKRPGHGAELARQAVANDYGAIIAVGGDGTVNEIASVLRDTDLTLGVIPRGSGNGLARALGIPLTVGKAIDTIVAGHTRVIDCCTANEYAFFTTCGVGYDAGVSDRFAKSRNRGPLQYVLSMIEEYLTYKPETYRITIDGRKFEQKAFLVTVANAPQYGNNVFIAPDARLDDGLLNVVIISPLDQIDVPILAVQLMTKKIGDNKKADCYTTASLSLERSSEGIIHLDGDPVKMGRKIDIKVHPRAIRLFAPPKK